MILGDDRREVLQVAAVARRAHHPGHGTAGEPDPAAMGGGDLADGVQARDVGGEAGDQHPVLQAAQKLHQRRPDLGLRARLALDQGVGGIADHGEQILVAERAQRVLVVVVSDQGLRVQLPVAGVQHRTRRGPDHQRIGLGDGMGERDQLDLERPHGEAPAKRHLDDLDLVLQAGLHQLGIDHLGGEGGGVDRAAQARPEVADRADVVLVGMGQDQPGQVLAARLDEGGIGHQHVDPGRAGPGEGDPEIDHQPLSVMAVEVQVHADLAGPAERQEVEFVSPGRPVAHGARAQEPAPRLARWMASRPRRVRSESTASMHAVARAKREARPPVAITFMGWPYSPLMRATRPSISPT